MHDPIDSPLNIGSVWNRWDPHIHTPGTVLNDQYSRTDGWGKFLEKLEGARPTIAALGVTDYLSIDRYEDVLRYRAAGRLPGVGFVFPNVEMRFGLETNRGSAINLHLLFCPDDPQHADEIRRFLRKLSYRDRNETYTCCRDDLIRLGRAHDQGATDEARALEIGTNQFKVSFDKLRELWDQSAWVRKNCLIAVAGGEADGTSGLRDESGAFAALRKSIEAFAHIIFSASPKQAEFWLGRGAATREQIESIWNGPKPCLIGSDAHDEARVGAPAKDRFCWLKGSLTFETLRQACIEPETRVHLGPEPPVGASPGQTITRVRVSGAPWMHPAEIPLNSGLIAVIGARGSGKTALADLVAVAGFAAERAMTARSFLMRAQDHLKGSRSEIDWASGETTGRDLDDAMPDDPFTAPALQYLSQQFVDNLCSAEGLADSLIEEIERVVFSAHPEDQREGASDFRELFDIRSSEARQNRTRYEADLEAASTKLAEERLAKSSLAGLKKRHEELTKQLEQDGRDQKKLVARGHEQRAQRNDEITRALESRKLQLTTLQARSRALGALRNDLADFRARQLPAIVERLKEARKDAGLSDDEWRKFKLEFTGDVDSVVAAKILATNREITALVGQMPNAGEAPEEQKPDEPLIGPDEDLMSLPISLLEREAKRLQKQIGIDASNAKKFAALAEKITKGKLALAQLNKQIENASSADERIQKLVTARREAYAGVIASIVQLESELVSLYAPLSQRLAGSSGALGKLSFSVKRHVDLEKWASDGEALLDLRKAGPFKGRGEILAAAKRTLWAAWSTGTPEDVTSAMSAFIRDNEVALKAHQPESVDSRSWISSIARWLHSTEHISVSYGLFYDGTDVSRLSPGTRGIVLLMVYLAIDETDDRPLIIDQPEENLDPQSVFDELVDRFREARNRRQIIIVTHNANLVVNTDVDQVIVATAQSHDAGSLPRISYESGGLEDPLIRRRVCDILEGGERAFRARARRLRLELR